MCREQPMVNISARTSHIRPLCSGQSDGVRTPTSTARTALLKDICEMLRSLMFRTHSDTTICHSCPFQYSYSSQPVGRDPIAFHAGNSRGLAHGRVFRGD